MSADALFQRERESARLLLAVLDAVGDRIAIESETHSLYVTMRMDVAELLEKIEQDAPPWEPERPETSLPWSQVVPGDEVKAPNGHWYRVDSVARVGQVVTALLIVNGEPVRSPRPAGQVVPVRRGETGQALDVFRAAGITVEVLA